MIEKFIRLEGDYFKWETCWMLEIVCDTSPLTFQTPRVEADIATLYLLKVCVILTVRAGDRPADIFFFLL